MLNTTANKEKNMAKEKKAESKAKKIINLVVMIVEIVIIIAGIILSITVIFGSKTKADELGNGINLTTVLSDSMEGNITDEFKISSFRAKADLLVIKSIDKDDMSSLEVGDVITYTGTVAGNTQLISHRITAIKEETVGEDKLLVFYTLGDKMRTGDPDIDFSLSDKIYTGNIQGVVTKKISGVGNIVFWFQDSTHFLWAVVIPLAALLAYNIYLFIRMIVDFRIKKAREEGQLAVEAIKAQSAIDEEEIKRKAIEEYLASQKATDEVKDEVKDVPLEETKEDK